MRGEFLEELSRRLDKAWKEACCDCPYTGLRFVMLRHEQD
jgi:hypothetical protein